jgi:5-methylcytosine-specific restriction endonuclease McrA
LPRTYTNKQKEKEQLGMAITTAMTRLQRSLMFRLTQQCDKDRCFRCGERIERVEDFSIDHKVAWLDRSPELFWDLENIAFSHLDCNRRAGRKPTSWNPKVAQYRWPKKKTV